MNFTGKRIHMTGIGGVSMSGLACILQGMGALVQGSDLAAGERTEALAAQGIRILAGHAPDHICFRDGAVPDLLVYSAAIRPDNPERQAAASRGIPQMERKDLLGAVMAAYPDSIAVSGTHGKTTTTSMISLILLRAGRDPSVHIGGVLPAIGGGTRLGKGSVFVTEADEYVESFLSLHPACAVVLNIDADHLDYYRDILHIRQAFSRFLGQVSPSGFAVVRGDDPYAVLAARGAPCRLVTFSMPIAGQNNKEGYYPEDIRFGGDGHSEFTLFRDGSSLCRIHLPVPGLHNIANGVAAAATCLEWGLRPEEVAVGLDGYTGAGRRFQYRGQWRGASVYDDYAHHPAEIRATLTAARSLPCRRILCVFQPHTYSRLKALLPDFARALALADRIIVTDIYAAREADPGDIHASRLVSLLQKDGVSAVYIPDFREIAAYLLRETEPGDLVLTMGAGDVYRAGDLLLASKVPVLP